MLFVVFKAMFFSISGDQQVFHKIYRFPSFFKFSLLDNYCLSKAHLKL